MGSGFLAGEIRTTSHVMLAATAITAVMKTTKAMSPRTVDTANLE